MRVNVLYLMDACYGNKTMIGGGEDRQTKVNKDRESWGGGRDTFSSTCERVVSSDLQIDEC